MIVSADHTDSSIWHHRVRHWFICPCCDSQKVYLPALNGFGKCSKCGFECVVQIGPGWINPLDESLANFTWRVKEAQRKWRGQCSGKRERAKRSEDSPVLRLPTVKQDDQSWRERCVSRGTYFRRWDYFNEDLPRQAPDLSDAELLADLHRTRASWSPMRLRSHRRVKCTLFRIYEQEHG